jgi:RNA polymerase sigma-70 factor (ECF subfamily)
MTKQRGDQAAALLDDASGSDQGREENVSVDSLVRENLPWLRGWLGARLHGHRRQDVDDLAQDIFVKALSRLRQLRSRDRFSAWLYRIADNRLKDYIRHQAREPQEVQGVELEVEDPRRVVDEIDRGEEVRALLNAMLALPAQYREPMILRHVKDLPYERIANILGISVNNVQVRIFRGRQMLRQSFGKARASRRRQDLSAEGA